MKVIVYISDGLNTAFMSMVKLVYAWLQTDEIV